MSTLLSAIRSLIFVLTLVVTVIPWALGVLVLSIFRRGDPVYWACAGWLKVAIWSARFICGIRWRIQGMENLPPASDRRAGVVLLSKHQSTWETFAYPALLSHPLAYVFKRELLYVPFFGWAMARMDMIHIDRGRRTEAWNKVLKQGKRLGGQGNWVIMFPEGTRIPRGEVASTRPAARAWPSRPACRSCPSPRPPRAAGRARASCSSPASSTSPSAARSAPRAASRPS
jgi:1-acyl-sn-glycerol-3-phosphate acyltransferase